MIGDVVGHGIPAAARMAELRNALRAYAAEGHRPGAALQRLDRLVLTTMGTQMVATVLFLVIDLATRSITLSRAGHLPPLVRAADGTVRVLDSGNTLPLGVIGSATPSEFTYALAGAEATCDRVLERLVGERPPGDDVAVLAMHVLAPDAGPLELELPARAESVTLARHRLRDWLRAELPGLDATVASDLEVAFCEACTNVVRHAYGPEDAVFRAAAACHGAIIELTVQDDGCWRTPRGDHGGRGLDLMRALCDDVAIERGPSGTRVSMRRSTAA
jgi:anti-sigma regulatory factor (Ser/Thr protein kinase)